MKGKLGILILISLVFVPFVYGIQHMEAKVVTPSDWAIVISYNLKSSSKTLKFSGLADWTDPCFRNASEIGKGPYLKVENHFPPDNLSVCYYKIRFVKFCMDDIRRPGAKAGCIDEPWGQLLVHAYLPTNDSYINVCVGNTTSCIKITGEDVYKEFIRMKNSESSGNGMITCSGNCEIIDPTKIKLPKPSGGIEDGTIRRHMGYVLDWAIGIPGVLFLLISIISVIYVLLHRKMRFDFLLLLVIIALLVPAWVLSSTMAGRIPGSGYLDKPEPTPPMTVGDEVLSLVFMGITLVIGLISGIRIYDKYKNYKGKLWLTMSLLFPSLLLSLIVSYYKLRSMQLWHLDSGLCGVENMKAQLVIRLFELASLSQVILFIGASYVIGVGMGIFILYLVNRALASKGRKTRKPKRRK